MLRRSTTFRSLILLAVLMVAAPSMAQNGPRSMNELLHYEWVTIFSEPYQNSTGIQSTEHGPKVIVTFHKVIQSEPKQTKLRTRVRNGFKNLLRGKGLRPHRSQTNQVPRQSMWVNFGLLVAPKR